MKKKKKKVEEARERAKEAMEQFNKAAGESNLAPANFNDTLRENPNTSGN